METSAIPPTNADIRTVGINGFVENTNVLTQEGWQTPIRNDTLNSCEKVPNSGINISEPVTASEVFSHTTVIPSINVTTMVTSKTPAIETNRGLIEEMDNTVEQQRQPLMDARNSKKEILEREMDIFRRSITKTIRDGYTEMMELIGIGTSFVEEDGELMLSSAGTINKERQERWKTRKEQGLRFLWNDMSDGIKPRRTIYGIDKFALWGIDIQMLADILWLDMVVLRRLMHRLEKKYWKKFTFLNKIDTPFFDQTKEKLTESDMEKEFNRPKGFVTIEGFFIVIMHTMYLREGK